MLQYSQSRPEHVHPLLWKYATEQAKVAMLRSLPPRIGNASSSVPYLKREHLIGARLAIDKQSTNYPLRSLFPREQYEGERLIVRVKTLTPTVGSFTSMDGAAAMVRPGTYSEIAVEPLYIRDQARLAPSDIALFAMYDEIIQKGGSPGDTIAAKVARRVTETADDISLQGRESVHHMYASALQGSFAYVIGDVTVTVTYPLNNLTATFTGAGGAPPAPDWAASAALIIEDMAWAMDQFTDAGEGNAVDTIVYNPKLWAAYMVRNEQWQTFANQVPGIAAAFMGMGSPLVAPDGSFKDPMWGLTWIPVRGPHTLPDGSSTQRWNVKALTFLALRADMQQVLEHSMVRDQYNPEADFNIEIYDQLEPKGTFVRYADNGAANIMIPSRVQRLTIDPS